MDNDMNNDLISREKLREAFSNNCLHNCYYCKLAKWDKKGACYNCGLIDNAPSVEPRIEYGTDGQPYKLSMTNGKEYERTQGEWVKVKEERMSVDMSGEIVTRYKCSKCGRVIATFPSKLAEYYPFCHCGADMRKGGTK